MKDGPLKCNEFGFLEVAVRSSPRDISDLRLREYCQNERNTYRKNYPQKELEVMQLRIAQRSSRATARLECSGRFHFLNVGRGGDFALGYLEGQHVVPGIDHTCAGVDALSPEVTDCFDSGDLFALLQSRIEATNRWVDHLGKKWALGAME